MKKVRPAPRAIEPLAIVIISGYVNIFTLQEGYLEVIKNSTKHKHPKANNILIKDLLAKRITFKLQSFDLIF